MIFAVFRLRLLCLYTIC